MKKLIILLTLALSFSFANAMSVRVHCDTVDESTTLEFKYTYENGFAKTEYFILERKGAVIIVNQKNKKSWNRINQILSEKLKVKTSNGTKLQFDPNISHTYFALDDTFLDIFIGNDYMINHFESEIFARSSYFNIFAYKQN